MLTSALALVLGSYQGSSLRSSQPSPHPCCSSRPPCFALLQDNHSVSPRTLDNVCGRTGKLACFESLVSTHQHQLPVVSEGAALGQPLHLGQTDKRLIFPRSLASTPTVFSIERDLLPPLLGEGTKSKGGGGRLLPLYLVTPVFSGAAMGRLRRIKLLAWGKWSSVFLWPNSGTRKAAMAKGLTAFSCLLLKSSLGDQGLLGPVMTPHVAFWLVPRRTFQSFSDQEGLSRRTSPVLTLSVPPISVVG